MPTLSEYSEILLGMSDPTPVALQQTIYTILKGSSETSTGSQSYSFVPPGTSTTGIQARIASEGPFDVQLAALAARIDPSAQTAAAAISNIPTAKVLNPDGTITETYTLRRRYRSSFPGQCIGPAGQSRFSVRCYPDGPDGIQEIITDVKIVDGSLTTLAWTTVWRDDTVDLRLVRVTNDGGREKSRYSNISLVARRHFCLPVTTASAAANTNNAPVITPIQDLTLLLNQTITIQVQATADAGEVLFYSLAGSTWGTINSVTGVISFLAGVRGIHDFGVTVQDSGTPAKAASASFRITVV